MSAAWLGKENRNMLRPESNPYWARRREREILRETRRIAVVGLRSDPIYKSYSRTQKLLERGFEIAPVIGNCESVLGLRRYGRLTEIEGTIDIVQFYTDSKADMIETARDTVEKRAKAFWVENGAASDEARRLLENAGVVVIEYRSLLEEYEMLAAPPAGTNSASNIEPLRRVSERMTRYPVTVTPTATIAIAFEKMKKGHFRHLPVVDEQNHLIGMFSERDLRLIHPSPSGDPDEIALKKFAATAMAEVATVNPIAVLPDTTLEHAAELMLRWNVEALPVIAGDDHLVGIITTADFLKQFIGQRDQRHG
jgi:uncharacterized protein